MPKRAAIVARSRSALRTVSSSTPNITGALNIGIFAAIGMALYWAYKKFVATTPFSDSSDKAETIAVSDMTTRSATTAQALAALQKKLSGMGLNVSTVHQANANALNADMDKSIVDHAHVIKTVKSYGLQTFQLTAIAYGQRELRNYRNSVFHLLDPTVWENMFSEKKLYGGLKYHLLTVLSTSEYDSLSAYVNSIP